MTNILREKIGSDLIPNKYRSIFISELEYLGFDVRFINILEERGKLLYLFELINKDYAFFKKECFGLGKLGYNSLIETLQKLDQLEERKNSFESSTCGGQIQSYKDKLSVDYFKMMEQ